MKNKKLYYFYDSETMDFIRLEMTKEEARKYEMSQNEVDAVKVEIKEVERHIKLLKLKIKRMKNMVI